jgi:hypothetical protein
MELDTLMYLRISMAINNAREGLALQDSASECKNGRSDELMPSCNFSEQLTIVLFTSLRRLIWKG